MDEEKIYEEYREISTLWGWLILIVFSLLIIGWMYFVYYMVPDAPKRWDVGQIADAPGESIYSTVEPSLKAAAPLQVTPIPEAQPLELKAPSPTIQVDVTGAAGPVREYEK